MPLCLTRNNQSRAVFVQDPAPSWVAKFNKLRNNIPGIYAIQVNRDDKKARNARSRQADADREDELMEDGAAEMEDDDDDDDGRL